MVALFPYLDSCGEHLQALYAVEMELIITKAREKTKASATVYLKQLELMYSSFQFYTRWNKPALCAEKKLSTEKSI